MKHLLVLIPLSLIAIACSSKPKEEVPPPAPPVELSEIKHEAEAVQAEEPAPELKKKAVKKSKKTAKKSARKSK